MVQLASGSFDSVSHFGTIDPSRDSPIDPRSANHPFPYQELSQVVLVWHAACIEKEQNPVEETETGMRPLAP
jgi:hypothetical protein